MPSFIKGRKETSTAMYRIGDAGFQCKVCSVSFKDNVSYIDHTHSPQHLRKSGQTGKAEKVTLTDVRQRIEWLAEQKGLK